MRYSVFRLYEYLLGSRNLNVDNSSNQAIDTACQVSVGSVFAGRALNRVALKW